MRVAVAGATGQIGAHAVDTLVNGGHDVVPISRSNGVDAYAGSGLDEALAGVDAVIDATNIGSQNETEIVDFFETTTRNLLAAEQRVGVRHHVLLSIVGIDKGQRVPHYSGKRAQEKLVVAGPVPWTVVRATQFFDLAATAAGWAEQDGVATIAPLLVQPIAPVDVGRLLAEAALDDPENARVEIAGPQTQDFVDLARRTLAARGQELELVPTWRGMFDSSMAGEVLLPGPDARIAQTTFEEWLAVDARQVDEATDLRR
jgi:uncharacterized protein YbjT (DUF2867 family)